MFDAQFDTPATTPSHKRLRILSIAGAAILLILAVVAVYLLFGRTTQAATKPGPTPSLGARSGEVALPFEFVDTDGLEVDGAGTVYVSDAGTDRVWQLKAGADKPTVLPFTGLKEPGGLSVDGNNAVYVVDQRNNRILKTAAAPARRSNCR